MLTPKKNNDIQCLRALAILLVMAQHFRGRLPAPQWYLDLFQHVGFWSGVDIFFALSGYLICKAFVADLARTGSRTVALRQFGRRRAARLLPALLFWGSMSVVIAGITRSVAGAAPEKIAAGAAASFAGIANFYWVHCVQTNLAACGNPDFNSVTWSLSLEWQLYLLLALLLCLLRPRGAVVTMAALALLMSAWPAPTFSYPWAFRPQAFTLGAAIATALAAADPGWIKSLTRLRAIALLCGGVALCLWAAQNVTDPYRLPLIAVGAGLCLISTLSGRAYAEHRLAGPLLWVGERSYSIYLCHLPILLLVHELLFRTVGLEASMANMVLALVAAAAAVLMAGDLSYRLIEQPMQRRWRVAQPGHPGL